MHYRRVLRARNAKTRVCAREGCTNLVPRTGGRPMVTCSSECRLAYRRAARKRTVPQLAEQVTYWLSEATAAVESPADLTAVWQLMGEAERAAVEAIGKLSASGTRWEDIGAAVGQDRSSLRKWYIRHSRSDSAG